MIKGAFLAPKEPQDPHGGVGDYPVLRGSLDGQVGSLTKALRFLDYCCLRTEVEGLGESTPMGLPQGANLV